jgi:WD40 repeat protein
MTADGTRVVAGNSDQNVRIYLLGGTQTVTPLAQGSQVRALALCRDGRRLLVATDDRDFPVRVWDVVSGRELERTGGRGSPVLALAVAADNKTYVAGNADGTTWLRTLEVRKAIISEKEKVLGAAFSADGKTVISCGDTPGVKVWDAEGALLRTFTDPKTARTSSEPAFRCIAVSPDGRLVAGADSSPGPGNRALIWNAADGKLLNTITGQTSVSCLAFSPDSQKLAVGSADQQLRIFRAGDALLLERFTVPAGLAAVAFAPDNVTLAVAAGNSTVALRCCLQRVLAGHQADVTSVHYLPDGKSLLSSGVDKTVRLWDVQEAKQTATLLVGSGTIGGIALSRDGRRFVTADADHVARVWELDRLAGGRGDGPVLGPDHANLAPAGGPTQPHVSVPLTGGKGPTADAPRRESGPAPLAAFVHSKPVRGVSISADGNRVATGCEDGSARIWDTATGKELERTAASPGNLSCVAFNLDATAILSGGVNGTVIRSDCCVTRSVDAHRGPIRGLRFAPDGSLFSAGEDKSLVRWSTRSWKVVQRYAPAAEAIRWMALSPCGRFVAAGEGPRVRLWNAADGQLIATVETPAVVTGLALGVGGGKLLVAGADKIIRNYAVLQNEGKYVCSLTHQTQEMPKAIGGLVLADDGSTLYSFCSDNTVPRWFMAAGPVRFAWAAHKGPIYGLRLGLDDTRLATAGADRAARIFNAADGKLVTALPEHGDRVMDVAFSNDGKQLATCGLDKTIRVFDAAGKLTKAVSDGIDGPLYTLAMAPPSGQFGQVLLAVAGPARTVQWWSPPADPPLRTLTGHNDAIYRVLFSPNGGRLATLDYSGGLLIWDTGGTLQYWQQLPVTAAYSMATAPEGQELAVATQDPRLLVITLPGGIW